MPRNGSGTYSLPQAPFVAGTTISSSAMNSDLSDIATALTGSLPRDGQAGMSGQLKLADGSTVTPALSFTSDTNTGFYHPAADQIGVVINGNQVALFTSSGLNGATPIGLISDYGGSSAPSLWYLCYGQNVSRTTYAALFAVIGTTFGSGDGSTTFGLPDLRGRVSFGVDNMGGSAAGRLTSTYFGSDPTVLGNVGGGQTKTLTATNQLPAYTPAGSVSTSVTNGTITINGQSNLLATGSGVGVGGGGAFGINAGSPLTASQATSTASSSFSGTSVGSSQPFGVVNPGIVLNKIIYAGA